MTEKKKLIGLTFKQFDIVLRSYLLIFAVILLVVWVSATIAKWVPIDENTLGLLSISSSILLLAVTIVYVSVTYGILNQTSNSQKINYLERRLEKLYLPLRIALKELDINSIVNIIENMEHEKHRDPIQSFIILNRLWHFKMDYYRIAPFMYLASENIRESLDKIITFFESNGLFVEMDDSNDEIKYVKAAALMNKDRIAELKRNISMISEWYIYLLEDIEKDIDSIKNDLAELVK